MTDQETTVLWKKGARKAEHRIAGVPLHPGDTVAGKYEVLGILGQGGMGVVLHARHVHFKREVAIKVLHPMLSRDELIVRRFEREAQAAGRIGSAHIAEVYDTGKLPSGERYIVMEYLAGECLASRIDRQGTLPPEELKLIVLQILEGLVTAHDAQFVHRDLKPSNIFLTTNYEGRDGFVKILDFGVSKLNTVDAGDVTETGILLGTPHYMAPEFIKGARHVDHRVDLYAVGVIMFRALSGMTPFIADNAYALIHKIAREDAPPLRTLAPDVDPQLAAIVDRALTRDLTVRYNDARQFIADLSRWGQGAVPPLRVPTGSIPPPAASAPAPPTSVPPLHPDSLGQRRASYAQRTAMVIGLTVAATVVFASGVLASTLLLGQEPMRVRPALAIVGVAHAPAVHVPEPEPTEEPQPEPESELEPEAEPFVQPTANRPRPVRVRRKARKAPKVDNVTF
jgi:serine/threonine protein kinase